MDRALDEIVAERQVSSIHNAEPFQPCAGNWIGNSEVSCSHFMQRGGRPRGRRGGRRNDRDRNEYPRDGVRKV